MRASRREFLKATGAAALVLSRRPLLAAMSPAPSGNESSRAWEIRVDARSGVHSFDPDQALGSSMDILPYGAVDRVYTEPVIKECLSAGWGPITYRQNTELQIAAWHWNHDGSWSDPAGKSGYFTGNSEPAEFLRHSYGYPLPRRGNTRNGGTERGYSRLTDGEPGTFWKRIPISLADSPGKMTTSTRNGW